MASMLLRAGLGFICSAPHLQNPLSHTTSAPHISASPKRETKAAVVYGVLGKTGARPANCPVLNAQHFTVGWVLLVLGPPLNLTLLLDGSGVGIFVFFFFPKEETTSKSLGGSVV